jgi:hypothetical protein
MKTFKAFVQCKQESVLLGGIPAGDPKFEFHSINYGAEAFLRSQQLRSCSRTSQDFLEPEGTLPCTEGLPLVPILSQTRPIHAIQFYPSKIHFNIHSTPTSWYSQWSLSFWLSHQYPICVNLLSIRATGSAHHILLDLMTLITLGEEYKL